MDRNKQIQSIRGICCLMIVLYHLLFRYNQLFNSNSFLSNHAYDVLGGGGVITFFIISGYYLAKPYEGNFKNVTLIYLKRFLNIYSPYLFAILIIFGIDQFGYSSTTPTWLDLIKNLFFIQYFSGTYVDGAHWYIIILVIFIIITYLVNLFHNAINKENTYFVLLMIYCILSLIVVLLIKFNIIQNNSINKIFKILFYTQFPKLIIGFSLYYVLKKKWIYMIPLLLSYVILIFVSYSHAYIIPITVFILILAFTKKLLFLEKSKILIFFGNCSYSIYLMHQNIGFTFENIFIQWMNYWLAFSISFILSIGIGICFYVLFETNIKYFIKKLFKGRM